MKSVFNELIHTKRTIIFVQFCAASCSSAEIIEQVRLVLIVNSVHLVTEREERLRVFKLLMRRSYLHVL